jgi:multisubunit Na+/H+ antiporter MnhG subunit
MIQAVELALLALIVVACWIGCLGMLRMHTPTQALHYLALPAGIASVLLPFAVFCATGWSTATAKAVLIALFLAATNSVVAHATARAFRIRRRGHWKPEPEDRIEYLGGSSMP